MDSTTSIRLSDLKNMFEEWQDKQEEKFNTPNSNMDALLKQNDQIRVSMQILFEKNYDIL